MSKKSYQVLVKLPSGRAKIWAGPQHQTGYLPTPEDDKHKTRRENVGNQLEALTDEKPEWQQTKYCYFSELTEEQVEEVKSWAGVRDVTEV